MFGYLFLILGAIGVVIAYPGEPLAWGFALLVFLGLAGIVYGHWHRWSADQAMIDMERRSRR